MSTRPSRCSECQFPFDEDSPIFGCPTDDTMHLCKQCVSKMKAKQVKQCRDCEANLSTGQEVFRPSDDPTKLLCKPCAEANMPKCAACGKPPHGSVARLAGKLYHVDCLKCSICSSRIDGPCSPIEGGLVCRKCKEFVTQVAGQARVLLQKGDTAGIAALKDNLKTSGLSLPSVIRTFGCDRVASDDHVSKMRIMAAFLEWDTDGDGCISEAELSSVLVKLGMPRSCVGSIFASADTNNDGKIDYEEFVEWMFSPAEEDALVGLGKILEIAGFEEQSKASSLTTPYEVLLTFWLRWGQ